MSNRTNVGGVVIDKGCKPGDPGSVPFAKIVCCSCKLINKK